MTNSAAVLTGSLFYELQERWKHCHLQGQNTYRTLSNAGVAHQAGMVLRIEVSWIGTKHDVHDNSILGRKQLWIDAHLEDVVGH
jgi:hypothetical protein